MERTLGGGRELQNLACRMVVFYCPLIKSKTRSVRYWQAEAVTATRKSLEIETALGQTSPARNALSSCRFINRENRCGWSERDGPKLIALHIPAPH